MSVPEWETGEGAWRWGTESGVLDIASRYHMIAEHEIDADSIEGEARLLAQQIIVISAAVKHSDRSPLFQEFFAVLGDGQVPCHVVSRL